MIAYCYVCALATELWALIDGRYALCADCSERKHEKEDPSCVRNLPRLYSVSH